MWGSYHLTFTEVPLVSGKMTSNSTNQKGSTVIIAKNSRHPFHHPALWCNPTQPSLTSQCLFSESQDIQKGEDAVKIPFYPKRFVWNLEFLPIKKIHPHEVGDYLRPKALHEAIIRLVVQGNGSTHQGRFTCAAEVRMASASHESTKDRPYQQTIHPAATSLCII